MQIYQLKRLLNPNLPQEAKIYYKNILNPVISLVDADRIDQKRLRGKEFAVDEDFFDLAWMNENNVSDALAKKFDGDVGAAMGYIVLKFLFYKYVFDLGNNVISNFNIPDKNLRDFFLDLDIYVPLTSSYLTEIKRIFTSEDIILFLTTRNTWLKFEGKELLTILEEVKPDQDRIFRLIIFIASASNLNTRDKINLLTSIFYLYDDLRLTNEQTYIALLKMDLDDDNFTDYIDMMAKYRERDGFISRTLYSLDEDVIDRHNIVNRNLDDEELF